MNKAFLNRKKELSLIEKRYDSQSFELIVIYGRRRIGKTQLLARSIEGRDAITCTGIKTTKEENVANLAHSLLGSIMPNSMIPIFDSYYGLFDFINHNDAFLGKKEIIILDEYPLLSGNDDELSSVLQYSIDHYWKDRDIKLVLCGSSISFMRNRVLSGDSPLFGRMTLKLEIRPFSYWEMKAYGWDYDPEEIAILYSALGGVPRYLNFVDSSKSVEENLYDIFLSSGAILAGEVEELLNEEFKETSRYSAILSTIASGKSSLNDISQGVYLQSGTTNFYISNMLRVGILRKEMPFDSKNNRRAIYSIMDGLFRFYFQFVKPNLSMIEFGHGWQVLKSSVMPMLPRYMGFEWEHICKEYMMNSFNNDRDPFLYSNLSRWWGGSRTRKEQIEIDLVATDGDSAIFCECKWRNSAIGIDVLKSLQEKSLQFEYPNKHWYLFSKGGFDDDLQAVARNDGSIHLIDLNNVYMYNQV